MSYGPRYLFFRNEKYSEFFLFFDDENLFFGKVEIEILKSPKLGKISGFRLSLFEKIYFHHQKMKIDAYRRACSTRNMSS